ncbi:MAG: hypothetical protein WCK74_08365 [Gemmatimonadaceae bacterium]
MEFLPSSISIGGATFLALIGTMVAGHRFGRARLRRQPGESESVGHGTIEGAVFALLGLMLAFSFSGAASRFADRRELITTEANAIGTAWLRIDLLPAASQPAIRNAFRQYVDARLSVYQQPADSVAVARGAQASNTAQATLWRLVVDAVSTPDGQRAITTVIPAMNDMFDMATTRMMAMEVHQPVLLYAIMLVLMLIASFISGIAMAPNPRVSAVHAVVFALTLALTTWLTLDLEFPRRGVLRIDKYDHVLTDLRADMNRVP